MSVQALKGSSHLLQTQTQLDIPSSGKYSTLIFDTVATIANNLSRFAVPAITLYALSNIPGAEAPGVAYLSCMAICSALCSAGTGGVGAPVCITACASACAPAIPVSILL